MSGVNLVYFLALHFLSAADLPPRLLRRRALPFSAGSFELIRHAAFEVPRSRKPHSRFPRHYYYSPNHGFNTRNTGAVRKGAGATAVAPMGGALVALVATAGVYPSGGEAKKNGNMSSHHAIWGIVLKSLRDRVRVRNEQPLNARSLFLHRTPVPSAFGLFIRYLFYRSIFSLSIVLDFSLFLHFDMLGIIALNRINGNRVVIKR